MRRFTQATLVLAVITIATPAGAQVGGVREGATVRATLNTDAREPLIGTLVSRTADSLSIVARGSEGIVRLPSSAIRSLEVRNGKHRLKPAIGWAVVGGGVWAVVSTVIPYDNCAERRTDYCADSRGEFVATQALGMALIAGVIGAIKGEDRWVRIEGSAPTAFITPSARGLSAGLRWGL